MKRVLKSVLSGVIVGSIILSGVTVFANQVVKVSIGNTVANVNGNNTTLSVAPYIQKSSGSMMIPLRFVSTALGIPESNIQYNPNTKEISITYNGKTAIFLAGTDKVYIDGKRYTMYANDTTSRTEIVNGSTFIPLRSLEILFDFKIDWEETTKTATLSNITEDKNVNVEFKQLTLQNTNDSLTENSQTVEKQNVVKTFDDYTEEEVRAMEEEVVRLVNEERVKYGLQPLEISEKLMETARDKSEDMANNNYFSHTDPSGYNMARDLNVGENITANALDPVGAMMNWLSSTKGHRENILDDEYRYIGVGFAQNNNADYQGYWTQQFSKDDKWAN